MTDLIIRKGHPIIEAGYKLSLAEQRIILLSLAKLDNRNPEEGKVILRAKDYAENFGVPENIAYRDLLNASKRLYERSIILKGEDEMTEFRWIESRTKYHKGEGRISFEFSRRVMPYLFELDKRLGYTQYHLLSVSGFTSTYSIRLYELFKKLQGMCQRSVTLEEIRRILMIEDKYLEFKTFRRDVLTPSLKEINEKSDILVGVETEKQGRTIVALSFSISIKNTQKSAKSRPKFPAMSKYGYCKLDRQNPKMSSSDYGNYAKDCLKILEDHYTDISQVTPEDLRNYWVFLTTNSGNKSKLGKRSDFVKELQNRGYKIAGCELTKI